MFASLNFNLADQILFANREVFQYLPYEMTMIFGSLAVHGASSWLLVYKRGTLSPISLNSAVAHGQLHRWSGYILSVLVTVHIAGVRILPLLLLNDPTIVDLSIVTSACRHRPWVFPLYYTALASTGLYHSLYGASLSLHQFGLLKTRLKSSTWNTIFWMCCGISAVTVASICGYWEDIKIVNEPEFEKIHNFITIFLKSRQYI